MTTFNELKKQNKILAYSFLIVGLLALAIITTLSVFLGLNYAENKDLKGNMENVYQASYYQILTNIMDIENGLNKLKVMTSPTMLEESMEKIIINCEVAAASLSNMNAESNNLRSLIKFVNQVGDYNKHLIRKLEKGEKLIPSERDILTKMGQVAKKTGKALSSLQNKIGEGYSFVNALGAEGDIFAGIITELENGSMEYPSLIYDGPFSDGIKDRKPLGLSGNDISAEEGENVAKKYLAGYNIKGIKFLGENNNRIQSYVYECDLDGASGTVQIAKKGGSLLMMDIFKDVSNPMLTEDDCAQLAKKYCDSIGLPNMKAVWVSNNNSTVYINLCYTVNDIIYYPDLVKVKVSLQDGSIMGFEGLNYAFNHTSRQLEQPKVSEEDALLNICSDLSDVEIRLALIPYTTETERLCYEISGKIDEEIYFIYVDAITGIEIKVMRVIDSSEGSLLL